MIIRRMYPEDLPQALRLTQAEAWAYRLEDWDFHYRLGRGWVACGDDGSLLGTALWWPYGEGFGTIGLVIVDRHHQGKGIGRRLMEAVMEDGDGRVLQLVATRAGTKLYEQCGFRDSGDICQHQGAPLPAEHPASPGWARLRRVTSADRAVLADWDASAFGTRRERVIAAVLDAGNGVLAEREGRLAGYALARRAGRGTIIGPVVADDELLAIELIGRQLQEITGFARIDAPAEATRLGDWLESRGLARVDRVRVMLRGAPIEPNERQGPARVFGLVSQALN